MSGLKETGDEKGKTNVADFPTDFLNMQAETFVSKFTLWLRQNIKNYSALAPYLQRIMASYCVREGAFWYHPELENVPKTHLRDFVEQGEMLCSVFMSKMGKDWELVTKTYPYGVDCQYRVQELFKWGDACRVVHSIMTRIGNVDGNSIDNIELSIQSFPQKFKSLHPRKAADLLGVLLQKASNVNATVSFRIAKEIVQILIKRNVVFVPLLDKYNKLPEHMLRTKCVDLLLELITDVQKTSDSIESSGGKNVWENNRVEEEGQQLLAVNRDSRDKSRQGTSSSQAGRNDGGGRKNFPECKAEKCSTKVCEARRSKERPYPPHPAGLCLEHFFQMIKNIAVKTKRGQYVVSQKESDGTWRYSLSNTPVPTTTSKRSMFISKEEEVVNEIKELYTHPSEGGTIHIDELFMVREYASMENNKRKREDGDSTFVERDFFERQQSDVSRITLANKE